MRIGSGFDVHRLVPDRDLVIGGVLMGEICLDLSRHRGWGKRLRLWTEAVDKKIFG